MDANLLTVLEALLSEKNVTRAAKRLGLGQPAVSHSLARLRNHFQDELLVLRGRTYFLTDRAERLAEAVTDATRAMAAVFDEPPSFDAATASSRFVVACSDLLGFILTPDLLCTLQSDAAHVELELGCALAKPRQALLDGVDLALGVFEDVPRDLNQQTLYEDTLTCVVREDHPGVGERLTLEAYGDLPHLEIASCFDAIPELKLERALAAAGKRRRVTLRTPYYLLAPRILERTDHVATLPTSAAAVLTQLGRLRTVPPPIALPTYVFSQIWRNDRNDDRAHTWLREHVARIFQHARRGASAP